jgi:hypothetical protein
MRQRHSFSVPPGPDRAELVAYLTADPNWTQAGETSPGVRYWEHSAGAMVIIADHPTAWRDGAYRLREASVTITKLILGLDESGAVTAAERLRGVLVLHPETSGRCDGCGHPAPCPTRRAVYAEMSR